MLRVGLTGNIGSGKSTVACIFNVLGIPVYPADERAKEFLMQENINELLARHFGSGILDSGGRIDKRALAAVVFSDPGALKTLNGIIHPLVMLDFDEWTRKYQTPYVLHEAAIIIESGFTGAFDTLIHVSCSSEVALGRVMRRDGADEAAVLSRMKHQMDDAEKSRHAEYRIINDGTRPVVPQVLEIDRMLRQKSLNK